MGVLRLELGEPVIACTAVIEFAVVAFAFVGRRQAVEQWLECCDHLLYIEEALKPAGVNLVGRCSPAAGGTLLSATCSIG